MCDDGLPVDAPASFAWSKDSGPGAATFADPAAPSTSVSFSVAGTYVLRLTVSDSEESASDTLTITTHADNRPPVVDAGVDRAIPRAGEPLVLGGSASDDGLPVGSTLAVAWTKLGGPGTVAFANPADPRTSVTFGAPGIYVLELRASDTALSAADTVTVRVATPCGLELSAGAAAWWPGNGTTEDAISGLSAARLGVWASSPARCPMDSGSTAAWTA